MKEFYLRFKYLYTFLGSLFFYLGAAQVSHAQTYCIPIYTDGCSWGDDISNVTLEGESITLNNSTTSCSANAYQDYTSLAHPDLAPGNTYTISISTGYSSPAFEDVRAWIDYNNNGIFEATETIANTNGNGMDPGTVSYDFTVPAGTVAGDYRLRVRLVYSSSSIDPCTSEYYGETEDYTVTVISLTPCAGMPSAGTPIPDFDVCALTPFNISTLNASAPAADLDSKWQYSPSGANIWTDIAGANSVSYNVAAGITAATDYRYIRTCTNSNLSDTSDVLSVTLSPGTSCYCDPVYNWGCNIGAQVGGVTTTLGLTNISNTGTGCNELDATGYTDFSATHSASAAHSTQMTVKVDVANYSGGVKVWIDWNQNGIFEPSELIGESTSTISPGNFYQTNFMVPPTAVTGTTKMRVRVRVMESSTVFDPCSVGGYGEAEDYAFEVIALQDCSTLTTPSGWTTVVDMDSLCVSGDVNITVDELIYASNVTYQLQQSLDGNTWTNVGVADETPEFTVTDVDVNTYFRVQWLCSNTVTGSSASAAVVINDPEVISTIDGYHCGPGQVVLEAQVAPGMVAKWYEDPNDLLPIYEGTTFTTPFLNASGTYYVAAATGTAPQPEEYVGTGTGSTISSPQPFYTTYWGSKNQYLIKASELQALGYSAGTITEVVFDVVNANGLDLNNFEMKLGMTNLTSLTSTFETTGMQTVYTATGTEFLTANTEKVFELDTYFLWDGVSNVILETCFNNTSWSSGNSVRYTTNLGFTASVSRNVDNSTVCSQTSGSTYTSRPNVKFVMTSGCESNMVAVEAVVNENPVVSLGANLAACQGHVFTLDAGPGFDSYLWSDNSTGQTLDVTTPGVYTVEVSLDGCTASDQVSVGFYDAPVSVLDAEVIACEGDVVELDAGNPGPNSQYLWSTGDTTQSIYVEDPGTYTVNIFNGACDIDDEVVVTFIEQSTGQSIHNTELGERLFQFYVVNPVNVENYFWDFGDGHTSTEAQPIHEYSSFGSFDVFVNLSQESCFDGDSLMRHIVVRSVDIDELVKADNYVKLYPNPASNVVTIELEEALQMKSVMIQDITGRVIMERQFENVTSEVNISTQPLASGLYQVVINTNEGRFVRKLEIIK